MTPRAVLLIEGANRTIGMGAADTREPGLPGDTPRRRRPATNLAWVLPHLIAYVAARGLDATLIRRLPGLRAKDFNDPDTLVSDATVGEAWRLAEHITDDGALGLHLAQAIPEGALDVLEYAFRTSHTLGAAVEQLERYSRVMSEPAAARLFIEGDAAAVTWGVPAERPRVEFAFAFLVRLAREATGTSLDPLEIHFVHAPPESLLEQRAFFRAPLAFHASSNRVVFAKSAMTLPLRSRDPALAGVMRRRLEKMLTQMPLEDASTAARVRRVLFDNLARGQLTVDTVARELGLSTRTLHRRLRAEGTTFRGILDSVRGEIATTLLRGENLGTGEVAFVLGYSEPAAFHRFFRRWTGQTPLAYRRAAGHA